MMRGEQDELLVGPGECWSGRRKGNRKGDAGMSEMVGGVAEGWEPQEGHSQPALPAPKK